MIHPMLILGGGAAALVLLTMGKKEAKASTPGHNILPVTSPPNTHPKKVVTGISGRKWIMQILRRSNNGVYVNVADTNKMNVLVFKQTGTGSNVKRSFVASPAGVDVGLVKTAMRDFGVEGYQKLPPGPADVGPVRSPGIMPSPTTPGRIAPVTPPKTTMPSDLRVKMAEALRVIGLNEHGRLVGKPSERGVQIATQVASELEAAGFSEAARTVRSYAAEAAKRIPPPPPERTVPLPPVIPTDLQAQINRAIQLERDPERLQVLVNALRRLPPSTERNEAIKMLEATIAQIRAARATSETLTKIDKVIKHPAPPPPIRKPEPPPPEPPPKSPLQARGEDLAKHLLTLQVKYGIQGAKSRRDVNKIKGFQRAAGGTADGLPGPGTMLALAKAGVHNLPLVMYWPRGSNKYRVLRYRKDLLALAAIASEAGDLTRAEALKRAAARERGQGGIVGPTL